MIGASAQIRVGIGGWAFAPWRGSFDPAGLPQREELAYASRRLSAIEINSTFHRAPSAATFAQWAAQVPPGFCLTVKAPRFITHRRRPAEARDGIQAFVNAAAALGDARGPMLWQLAPTHQFDALDCATFLDALPAQADGRSLRHALAAGHPSFRDPRFAEALRERAMTEVVQDATTPTKVDPGAAGWIYARLKACEPGEPDGDPVASLDALATTVAAHAAAHAAGGHDVHLFLINGAKLKAPRAAQALLARLPSRQGDL